MPKLKRKNTIKLLIVLFVLPLVVFLVHQSPISQTKAQGGNTYYLAPNGNNSNPGTKSQPWKTFTYAIPRLQPGDTLSLLDGTYTSSTTGFISIDSKSGTQGNPITIKAENERMAFLKSNGDGAPVYLRNASYWNIIGLRARNADVQSTENLGRWIFRIDNCHHITLKRCLGSHNNRYYNSDIFWTDASEDILFEECEAYDFHRHGFCAYASHNVTFRRCYANSRGRQTIPGGYGTNNPEGGDETFASYQSSDCIVENCISENKNWGFHALGGTTFKGLPGGHNNRFLGCISLNDTLGGALIADGRTPPANNLYKNFLVVGSGFGISVRGGSIDTQFENFSAFNAGGGIAVDNYAAQGGNRGRGTTIINSLLANNSNYGIYLEDQDSWQIEYSNSYGNGTNYSPSEDISDSSGHIRNSLSVAPTAMNECKVYVSANSNMKGAGKDGADIGANILYRYEDGVLTDQPLWDPMTGAFPHGTIVAGINDIPGSSCFDVHQRLNVNPNTLPPGYGGSISPSPTPSPTPTPTPGILPGLSWEAEEGVISSPFTVSNEYVYQSVESTEPGQGGQALYRFNITSPGDYLIKAVVDAPNTGADSFFINIDNQPTTPAMIWDIPLTSGFEERTVSWRGSGTYDANEFVPKVFNLTTGEHQLIIRGREANTHLDRLSIAPLPVNPYDLNGDGQVNGADVLVLLGNWINGSQGDFNSDGKVNSLDLGLLVAHWGD